MFKKMLPILLACWGSFSCHEATEEVVGPPPQIKPAEQLAAAHRMFVFGRSGIYLSHLPEEGSSRKHQVILMVSFQKQGLDMLPFYNHDRRRSLSSSYSLLTEPFPLSQTFGKAPSIPHRRSFRATLYRGITQAPEDIIARDVTVQIERIVLARDLTKQADDQPLSYFLFGNNQELFAAHWMQDAFDFDHIALVNMVEGLLTTEQAAHARGGTLLNVLVKNDPRNALREAHKIEGLLTLQAHPVPITFDKLETLFPAASSSSF